MADQKVGIQITASDKTKAAFKSVDAGLKAMTGRIFNMRSGILGLVGAGGLGALIKVNADVADAAAKAADKIGIEQKALMGLHFAAEQNGGSIGMMNEALVKAVKRLGEFNATGGGAAAKWLKELNLDTQELASLSPDELFNRYADAIGGLNSRGEQLAAISALMGDGSRSLIGLMSQGREVIQGYANDAERLGIAISRVDAAQIEQANDALNRVSKVTAGLGTVAAAELSSYFTVAANYYVDNAKLAGEYGGAISESFETIALSGARMADTLSYPLGVVKDGMSDIWNAYLSLPTWAQEIGVAGALIGGKKGVLIVAAMSKLAADTKTTAEWFAAYTSGQISFGEWLAGGEEGEKRLELLKEKMGMVRDEAGGGPSILGMMFGTEDDDVEGKFESAIQRYLETARSQREQLQEKINSMGGLGIGFSQPDTGDTGGGTSDKEEKEHQRYLERLQRRYEALNQSLLSERDLEILRADEKRMIFDEMWLNDLLTEEDRNAQVEELERQHQDKMNDIAFKGMKIHEKFAVAFRKGDIKGIAKYGALMTQGVAQQNRSLFEANKAFALADAAVTLPDSVLQSWNKAGGYPAGIIPAGLMLATGLAEIQAIRSTSFTGGGSGSGGSGGGVAPSLAGTGASSVVAGVPAVPQITEQTEKSVVEIHIHGNLFETEDTKEFLVETIQEATNDQDIVLFDSTSRQAMELQP